MEHPVWGTPNLKENLWVLYYKKGRCLREIGEVYGVTRECIRQAMERFEFPRRPPSGHSFGIGSYKTLEQYLASANGRKCDSKYILDRFIAKEECQACGNIGRLHYHHRRYPAVCRDDLEVLCSSCHQLTHKGKVTRSQRQEVYAKYKDRIPTQDIANEYGVARITVYKIIDSVRCNRRTLRTCTN